MEFLQHYPMYRHSEAECTVKDIDSIPVEWEYIENKPKYDCLSQDATQQVSFVVSYMTFYNPRINIHLLKSVTLFEVMLCKRDA